MKKWFKVALLTSTVAAAGIALAACGSNSKSDSGSSNGNTVVSMYMPGDKPKNYDDLIKKANDTIHKTYPKIDIKMNFIGWGDYDQKYNVMITSGDSYDLAFAKNYTTNAQKGVYADMTDMLKTTGKKAYDAVDPSYWKGLTINGKIYGFPVNANIYSQSMATFNSEFVKKYGLDISGVNNYQTLEPALKKFHAENPGVTAFAIGKDYRVSPNGYDAPMGNNLPFAVDATGKSKEVVNIYDTEQMQKDLATLHDYYLKGYVAKDAATSSTQYNLQDNTWLVRQETVGPFDYGDTALINAAGGKKLESKPLTDPYKTTATSQVAIWSISKTSNHKKEAMQVLNLLNTNKDLLNNIVWGIQGTQWKFTDEANGKIETTKAYKPNTFVGAWMMGNNKILYTQKAVTAEDITERDKKIKDAPESVALGFSPDLTKVKTEVTNISNVMSKYNDILNTGTADPLPTIKKMNAELKTAGYDKVQAELQKQYDAFLKDK